MAVKRLYIPFKDLSFDAGAFANDKLLVARNVIPWHGTYVLSPGFSEADISASTGNQTAIYGSASFRIGYEPRTFVVLGDASNTHIFEDDGSTITDRTDAGGYAVISGAFAQFAQFGGSVVCTLGDGEEVQYLASGAADFAPMVTSTFAPRAFFAAPVRGNLFLANIYTASPYDTLAAGNHPSTIAVSQTDNIQAFGSPTTDPQLVGAVILPITNDGGDITGLVGGDYAIVFQERAVVRIDGPPYSVATIAAGIGTTYPNSCFRYGRDTYFWSNRGPMVMRDGGYPEPFLIGSLARALSEFNASPFDEWVSDWMFPGNLVTPTGFVDEEHGLIGWVYYTRSSGGDPGWNMLLYNVEEQRASLVALSEIVTEQIDPGAESFVFPRVNLSASDGPLAGSRWYVILAGGSGPPRRRVFSLATEQNYSGRLYSSFIRLEPNETSRVARVRPVYRGTNLPGTYTPTSQPPVWVQVSTVTNPSAGEYQSDWHNVTDGNGWITIPPGGSTGSALGDFHSIRVRFGTAAKPPSESSILATDIREFDGVEIEYEYTGVQSR